MSAARICDGCGTVQKRPYDGWWIVREDSGQQSVGAWGFVPDRGDSETFHVCSIACLSLLAIKKTDAVTKRPT